MTTYFTKSNSVIAGVTPFYYMFMSGGSKDAINGIVKQMPIELILPFTNTVEEIYNYLQDVINDRVEIVDPQQEQLMSSSEVSRFFYESLDNDFLIWAPRLIEIRNSVAETYTDVNFEIGNIDLKSLLAMTAPSVEDRMKIELAMFMDGVDEGNTELTIKFIDQGEELVKRINQAIEIVKRKITIIENSYIKKDARMLREYFRQILAEVSKIDHVMINSHDTEYIRTLRTNLRELGLNTDVPLYHKVSKQQSSVESLSDRKEYNKSTLVSLENKRAILERSLVSLVSKINGVRESISASKYYF